jgi:hypothetical protein|tara:strand:+ start:492 stop:722 length:231 start_codon:yes stop_codon:yes gene_type:complete
MNKYKQSIEIIIMEILAKKYIKICQENKMCFPDYIDICKEEALKEITKKNIKKIYKKNTTLSKNVILHKPKLSFKE